MNPSVLVVDDDEAILFSFERLIASEGFEFRSARNGTEGLARIKERIPSVVFLDITMPGIDGIQVLQQIKEYNPSIPVIIVTGFATMQNAIRAIQAGAYEYLTKPLNIQQLRVLMHEIIREPEISETSVMINSESTEEFEIVGTSPQMQETYKLIATISATPNRTSVLITGESGTGKELVARAVHRNNPRGQFPFIAVNCMAVPEQLLESELFGHERGSFTGAVERKIGKFESAGKGTIFLDEIGDLSPLFQQKLLRVLQEREYSRIGGNKMIEVEARFITATNRNLEQLVREGKFREDLFYRLKVAVINLAPLRERRSDLPLLVEHFISKYNKHFGKKVKMISGEGMAGILNYDFPGNVRELENLIERAVMISKADLIRSEQLSELTPAGMVIASEVNQTYKEARQKILFEFERKYLIGVLEFTKGNVTSAAKRAGMTRQNFQRLLILHHLTAATFRNHKQ